MELQNESREEEVMLAFDIDSYNDFCEKNNYKPGYYQSLLKFESFCRSYGINTRPLKQK